MTSDARIFKCSLDKPVKSKSDDLYGLSAVAQGLSQAILAMDDENSATIGIEGPWGSGKTSMVNLLLEELKNIKSKDTHILHVSPWINGDNLSLVGSLLIPIAHIISQEEDKLLSGNDRKTKELKKRIHTTSQDILRYVRSTARLAQPVAEIASVLPYLGSLDKVTKALTQLGEGCQQTAAELRTQIEQTLNKLGLTFVVVIDDLDRLEPVQAVEVLRMVRSVADFPRFRYILCYDREVLANAVQRGLGVPDGRLYLQKIIQLSFSLPRTESFELRRAFHEGACSFYLKIHSENLDELAIKQLKNVIDIYGGEFSTPREVNLALTAIKFRYPAMRDYVYFPDLCVLQLFRVVNPGLYDWIELYLTKRAVVESRDERINEADISRMETQLISLLEKFNNSSAKSAWNLGRWVPGIEGRSDNHTAIFQKLNTDEHKENISEFKRLGNTGYWRYYFSFSAPQNVLSESEIEEILHLAGSNESALDEKLINSITGNRISSRTWFEHIITRMTPKVTATATLRQRKGLLGFFFRQEDVVERLFIKRGDLFYRIQEIGSSYLGLQLIGQILEEDYIQGMIFLRHQFSLDSSLWWSMSIMLELFSIHGQYGFRETDKDTWLLTLDDLKDLKNILAKRMGDYVRKSELLEEPNAKRFINNWCTIDSTETVRHWVSNVTLTDEGFLKCLLAMRDTIHSSARGIYRSLQLSEIKVYFTTEEIQLTDRLHEIELRKDPNLQSLLEEVQKAIVTSRNF